MALLSLLFSKGIRPHGLQQLPQMREALPPHQGGEEVRPYELVTLLRDLNEARTRAYDALEACPDPGAIIDEETYARAIMDAGIDPTGIVGVGDPVYMINIPSFMSIEVEAYTLLAKEEKGVPLTP